MPFPPNAVSPSTLRPAWLVAIAGSLVMIVATSGLRADPPAFDEAAAEVDRLLAVEWIAEAPRGPAERTDDEVFLRRVFLDLVGANPTPEDVLAFALDDRPDKRERVVGQLLDDPEFSRTWARYWRDVILYRRSEERALLVAQSLEDFLTEQLEQGSGWHEVATSMITATGDVRENGATGLIMAQSGAPEETVAEISRIFMGIQIQCAQCHDHPYDRWQREQFHQLAAFFPRVAVRPTPNREQRSFLVVAQDQFGRGGRRNNNNRYVGTPEHRMPDLEDPAAPGEIMQPVFFVSGESLDLGARDRERRETLAEWITSPDNPWFARAYVNRIWSELVGEGFYEPVDDMGPDRESLAPQTLDYLATTFAEHDYDVRWLFQTITSTDAYQRVSAPRRDVGETPYLANCAQRLRGDQLFSTLAAVLGIPDQAGPARGGYGIRRGPRTLFTQAFGYDPSDRRDDISGTIPQALLLMNSPLIEQGLQSRNRNRGLGRLLLEFDDNEALTIELYMRTLARQPSREELATCLIYVRDIGDRNEAFEDILWVLVNTTEFLHRR